jgi:CotS family spore coat protein
MVNNDNLSVEKPLSKKEYQDILHIMEHYHIKPEKITRHENSYKIKSHHKYYCLSKVKRSDKNSLKGIDLSYYLKENKFNNVIEHYKTKDNKSFVKGKKNLYYLTEWVSGKPCDKGNLTELKNCAKLLAEFHVYSKGFFMKGFGSKSKIKNWNMKCSDERKDLLLYKRLIDSKKVKTPFDIYYYNNIDINIKYLDLAEDILNKCHHVKYCDKAVFEGSVCFSNFLLKNVTCRENGEFYITNLRTCTYGNHVYDLAIFMRKILNNKNYGWDFDVANELIGEYCSSYMMNNDEFKLLLAFIIFPHRFWKLGKKKYLKNKKLSEERFIGKLSKIIRYESEKMEFVNKYILKYCSE